ncbi:MAG TPA: class I SAM-dependent methyltransferase [Frankiaceae bacterium]|nr:class I SAM-dependent methyltransferase [Frankiaceae bacterium]
MPAATPPRTSDPGSFRDPASSVFYAGGDVLRGLNADAAADWAAMSKAPFFAKAMANGRIVKTEELPAAAAKKAAPKGTAWDVVLKHERVPFISYAYEWTFSQLQDAALLHLDLLSEALEAGLSMKDGYVYNVQFHGAQPVFIDTPSFERSAGGPWPGYRQFCRTFLFPLMLTSYKDVSFRPLLRGQLDGIEPKQMRNIMSSPLDVLKGGVLKNVLLHSAIEGRMGGDPRGSRAVGEDLKAAGFSAEVTKAAVKSLRKLVAGMKWDTGETVWKDYRSNNSYSDEDTKAKQTFVDGALAGHDNRLVWDLGANDGAFSRIAAKHSDYVVAADFDEGAIEPLYRQLRNEKNTKILPVVLDLVDPSPSIGWRTKERPGFFERQQPDVVLMLALLHHIAISKNVPLAQIVEWMASFGSRIVVEFVHHDDVQTKRLLANKPEGMFPDYRVEVFEKLLGERFTIEKSEPLPSGTRTMYVVTPRG